MNTKNNLRTYLRVNTKLGNKGQQVTLKLPDEDTTPQDDYLTKIIKYIPSEIVTVYLVGSNMIKEETVQNHKTWLWAFFGIIFILTPLYRWQAIRFEQLGWDRSAIIQALISTLAYVVWAFALGGPFEESMGSTWNNTIGTLVLLIATLTLPLVDEFFITE